MKAATAAARPAGTASRWWRRRAAARRCSSSPGRARPRLVKNRRRARPAVPLAGSQRSRSCAGLAAGSAASSRPASRKISIAPPGWWRAAANAASALATNVHRVGHAALGFGRPQRCWRSLRMRARSRRWAARTSGWRAWALRQRRYACSRGPARDGSGSPSCP